MYMALIRALSLSPSLTLSPSLSLTAYSGDSPVDSVLAEGSEKYLEKLNMGGEDPIGTCVCTT